jgi:hypothetical protein
VFTRDKVIVVSLIENTQRAITYPNGVFYIDHSLNVMMKGVPYLIIATFDYSRQIRSDIE